MAPDSNKSLRESYLPEADSLAGGFVERADEAHMTKTLIEKVEQLSLSIEKMKIAEYVELLNRPWRLLYINFIAGVARGLGSAVGWVVLATILVAILRRLVTANLPLISEFIADLVLLVQNQLAR